MYRTGETIAALSSPSGPGIRHIIRISGPLAFDIVQKILRPVSASLFQDSGQLDFSRGVRQIVVDADGLAIQSCLYIFPGPVSYTGDDLAELHINTNQVVAALMLQRITESGALLAEPGEFTARAYLSGKLDLSQAEAVAEIVAAGNRTQLAAAEKLLEGRLSAAIAELRRDMLDLISLLEAGLDFSEEGIEFITTACAAARLKNLQDSLERLLSGNIHYEAMLDMPAVAITGAPNAGKSSLLNALLGRERAIVSDLPATTRDVLTDILHLEGFDCVIFDCAGISEQPHSIIDELAQETAIKAIASSALVILCIDATQKTMPQNISLFSFVPKDRMIPIATKVDLLKDRDMPKVALMTSAKTGEGIEKLREIIASRLKSLSVSEDSSKTMITQRHTMSVKAAIEEIARALQEVIKASPETASMYLRGAWDALAPIESEPVDEAVLNSIFSRFCIGK